MKILLFFALIFTIKLNTFSQVKKNNQIDISGYIFVNNVFRFSEVDGDGYAENGEGYRFGIQYSKYISERIAFNSGLGYLQSLNVYHGAGTQEPAVIQSHESNIYQIPIRIRYDLFKWLYFKSGITIDFQSTNQSYDKIDNQSGIGYSLISGIDLKISESIWFNIEPELGITSLIPFNGDKYQQHFLMAGLNVNIGYRF